jgi:hypothetical protein
LVYPLRKKLADDGFGWFTCSGRDWPTTLPRLAVRAVVEPADGFESPVEGAA